MSTRGEENNNPGNIRKDSTIFQGEVPGKDTSFKTFATSVMGIRAIAKILLTYFDRYGLNTIAQIISRWAPSNENNTVAYIDDVAHRSGFGSEDALDLGEPANLVKLVSAIIWHENGEMVYTEQQIEDGVEAAY